MGWLRGLMLIRPQHINQLQKYYQPTKSWLLRGLLNEVGARKNNQVVLFAFARLGGATPWTVSFANLWSVTTKVDLCFHSESLH